MSEYDDDIAALTELSEDEYRETVADSLDVEDDWPVLLDPAVVARTVSALHSLQVAVQHERNRLHETFQSPDTRNSAPKQSEIRRALAKLGARSKVLNIRIGQAAKAQRNANRERNVAAALAAQQRRMQERQGRDPNDLNKQRESRQTRKAIRLLTLAIQRHRLAAIETGLTPEPADRQLWDVLDEVEIPFNSGSATLTEVLGQGAWFIDCPEAVTS